MKGTSGRQGGGVVKEEAHLELKQPPAPPPLSTVSVPTLDDPEAGRVTRHSESGALLLP